MIQTLTAGVENFLPYVPDGVQLCNAAGVHDASTAELAVGLIIASGRGLDEFARNQTEGRWQPFIGRSLADRQGADRRLREHRPGHRAPTGRLRGRLGHPGGPRARTDPVEVLAQDDLDRLLPEADVVILIAPHTPETEKMINAERLALLPDGALVVNVARGALVDTDALLAETASGRLCAALDVTDPEPLPPDHPLWRTPGGADRAACRRGQFRILPSCRSSGRRAAAPFRQRRGPTEQDPMSPLEPAPDQVSDPTCVFCRIIAGELPSRRIYEDDHAIAFLDIAAWHRGHSLVVSRRHVPDLITGPPMLAEIAPAIDAVSRLLIQRLAADGINFLSSAREIAGQEVFHVHVHVVPRYADEPGLPLLVNRGVAPDGELDSVYRQIQAGGDRRHSCRWGRTAVEFLPPFSSPW